MLILEYWIIQQFQRNVLLLDYKSDDLKKKAIIGKKKTEKMYK